MSERIRRLMEDLEPYPGRGNLCLRTVISSAVVIFISMTLEIPFLAISLIVVFYLTQSNIVLTRLVGIMFIIGSALGVAGSILMMMLTYDIPLLRILTASAAFFACMYLMRVTKVGAMFFVIGICFIYVQSMLDLTDHAEMLVRLALWAWVAANYAIAVTLVVNTLLLPADPVVQLRQEILLRIRAGAQYLAHAAGEAPAPQREPSPALVVVGLLKLLRFSTMRDPAYRRREAWHLARIAAVVRLYECARELASTPSLTVPRPILAAFSVAYADLAQALSRDGRFSLRPELARLSAQEGVTVASIVQALQSLARNDAPDEPDEPDAPPAKRESLFLSDALANPAYVLFALKTLLAVLLGYLYYRAVDWDGIHTVMLTCLIVAQSSLGATARRSWLRIAGAAIGSGLALFMVVFVVPHLDDIVGVLAISLPVIALGAWVTASSERLSYAGIQIMFTFALALLEQFGPSTDLTEIRDRIVGIVMGVLLSLAIHATLSPEREGEALRQRLAVLLRNFARSLRSTDRWRAEDPLAYSTQILKAWADYHDCRESLTRITLEPNWQLDTSENEALTLNIQAILRSAGGVLAALDAFRNELSALATPWPARLWQAIPVFEQAVAEGLEQYADRLAADTARLEPVVVPSLREAVATPLAQSEALGAAISDALLARADELTRQVAQLPVWRPVLRADPSPASQSILPAS